MKVSLAALAFLTFFSVANALELPDQQIKCHISLPRSERYVKRELNRHPEAVGRTGDDGAILVTQVTALSLRVESGIATGKLHFGDREVSMEESNVDFDRKIKRIERAEDGRILLVVAEQGWDHFVYTMVIDPNHNRGRLKENFDYDCGGPGSVAYGVYVCTTEALN